MTLATTGGGTVARSNNPAEGIVGLEDVEDGDLVVPRLNISHKTGKFVNSVTGEEYDELHVIMFAQVRQRVMWDSEVDENYKSPQCKSPDFDHGFPNVDPKAPAEKLFPWKEGNFDVAAGKEGRYDLAILNETGLPSLPCASCKFKEWENKKTRCKEQHVYPLLYSDGNGNWAPAILTVQGSSVKGSKAYVSGFVTLRAALYTNMTKLTLTRMSRGSVDYAVINFTRETATDVGFHGEYATQARAMRDYLRRLPAKREETDESVEPSSNVNVPPPASPTVVDVPVPVQVPVPEAAPAPPVVVAPAPAPAAPPAQPAAPPVQPAAPAAPPVVVAPPAAPQAPVAPTVAPPQQAPTPATAPVPEAAAAQTAAPVAVAPEDDDDLPF